MKTLLIVCGFWVLSFAVVIIQGCFGTLSIWSILICIALFFISLGATVGTMIGIEQERAKNISMEELRDASEGRR
jgi:hypothetical protein